MPQPGLILEPDVQPKLHVGIAAIAAAVKPTLGPLPHIVAANNVMDHKPPELLDSGAAIARRIVELPDRLADVGAMLMRHTLWQVQEEVGDGVATSAVLFEAIYSAGRRFIAAGGDAMQLRAQMQALARNVAAALDDMSEPVHGADQLRAVAASICNEPSLAWALGEAFETLGEWGQLDLRKAYGRDITWEYVDGAHWERGIETRAMLESEAFGRLVIADAAVLVSDLKLDSPQEVLPLIVAAMKSGRRGLLLIADEFSDEVKTFLLANRNPGKFGVIPVRAPFSQPDDRREALEDIALMTGGSPILGAAGQTLTSLRLSDLGKARQVWASKALFGFSSGGGDPRRLREHARQLQTQFDRATDLAGRRRVLKRLGKLMGGSATLYTGGASESEIEYLRESTKRAAATLRAAIRSGVVPGGGIALLRCREQLPPVDCDEPVARAADRILRAALSQPTRVIAANAGLEAGEILAALERAPGQLAFDARSGKVMPLAQSRVYDVASVLKAALLAAVSGATQALTIEAVVQHRNPETTYDP